MTLRLFGIVALVLNASGISAPEPAKLELDVGRPRCYGGTTVTTDILAARPELTYRWQTSVRGAVIERDNFRADKEGTVTLEFRTPAVERIAPLELRVEALRREELVARGEATFLVFPPYQPAGLKKAVGGTTVGIAATGARLLAMLEEAGVRCRKISSRMSLELFEGDVLIAAGEWLDGEGKTLVPLIRERLRRGLHLIVLEPQEDWSFFPFERQFEEMPAELSGRTLLSDHPLIARLWYLSDCRGMNLFRPVRMGAGGPCNLRVLSEETSTRLPLLAEVLPPGDGVVLFVGFPVASNIETDPAAPLLLGRCLRYLARPAVPRWRHVFTSSEDKGAAAQRLRRLGVQASDHKLPSADLRGQLLVEAYERLAAEQEENQSVELPEYLRSWIRDGNDALILVGAAPQEKPVMVGSDMLTKGIPPALLRSLAAKEGQAATQLPDFGLKDKTRVLVSGLLARIDMGGGRLYVLRDGFEEDERAERDEIPAAWLELLSVVFTNLGVRIEGK